MNTTDRDREAFETWMREDLPRAKLDRAQGSSYYIAPNVDHIWRGWQAALAHERARAASPAPQAPDGWALVPVKPTREMIEAGDAEYANVLFGNSQYITTAFLCRWRAAIAAAPPAPVASHEPASVGDNPGCVLSESATAQAAWNSLADGFNQWDTLDAHERRMAEGLFSAGRDSASPPPEPVKAEVDAALNELEGLVYGGVFKNGPSLARALKVLRIAIATPPTAPAAARSAAEEMRKAAAGIVSEVRMGERDSDLRSIIRAIRALPLPGEEA